MQFFQMSFTQGSFSYLRPVSEFEVDREVKWDDKHDWKKVLGTAGDHGVSYLGRSLPGNVEKTKEIKSFKNKIQLEIYSNYKHACAKNRTINKSIPTVKSFYNKQL